MDIRRPKSKQQMPDHAKRVYKGEVFDVYQWEQELYDGNTKLYERIKRRDAAVCIPITEDGKIILLDQTQPGRDLFIGFPGGVVDPGEGPDEAGKRELLEETGYEVGSFDLWVAEQPLNYTEWAIYNFIARGCKKVQEQQLEGGEKIKIREVTLDELLKEIKKDNFINIGIALRLLKLELEEDGRQKIKKLLFG